MSCPVSEVRHTTGWLQSFPASWRCLNFLPGFIHSLDPAMLCSGLGRSHPGGGNSDPRVGLPASSHSTQLSRLCPPVSRCFVGPARVTWYFCQCPLSTDTDHFSSRCPLPTLSRPVFLQRGPQRTEEPPDSSPGPTPPCADANRNPVFASINHRPNLQLELHAPEINGKVQPDHRSIIL